MIKRAVALLARRISRPGRLSSLTSHTLLAVGSAAVVTLALLGAELLARRLSPGYLVATRGLHVFSRSYGWAGRPGAAAQMGEGRVTLNSRGYRGRELPLPKTGERTRAVVLGDSIAFGFGVADEQAFPHLLDVRDNGIEAGNYGVQGYGPGQELQVLLNDGLRQDPDVVLLAVCLRNDLVDAMLPVALYDGRTPRPRFHLVDDRLVLDDSAVRLSVPRRTLQRLVDESHLLNRLLSVIPRPQGPEDVGWRQRKQEALRDEDYALRLSVALVVEMAHSCHQRDIGFIVAAFPSGLSYEVKPPLHARFLESLQAEGIAVVDMGAHFHARGVTPGELSLDRTGHLGPRGHALTAEVLEREIAAHAMQARHRPPTVRPPSGVSTGGTRAPSGSRVRALGAVPRRLFWPGGPTSRRTHATPGG